MEEFGSAEAGSQFVSRPAPRAFGHNGGEGKSPAQFDVRPDVLTGLLERAALSEERRSLMSTVLKKIPSATSGLNEAFTSLLRGFEVCNGESTISLIVRHALGVLHIDSSP